MLPKNIIEILQEPLPIHQRKGPGGIYKYVKGEDVVKQLNKAFGHAWSSKAIFYQEQHKQVLVLVEVSVVCGDVCIVHQAFGSSPIARHNKDNGDVIDLGNSYKSAFTTALKKAAEQFGVGKLEEDEADSYQPAPQKNYSRPAVANQARPAPQTRPATSPPVAKPMPKPSSAPQAVKHQPAPAPVSNAATFVEEKPINDLQKNAIKNLSKLRGVIEADLMDKTVPGMGKSSIDQLTNLEAIKAIQYLNTIRSKQ